MEKTANSEMTQPIVSTHAILQSSRSASVGKANLHAVVFAAPQNMHTVSVVIKPPDAQARKYA